MTNETTRTQPSSRPIAAFAAIFLFTIVTGCDTTVLTGAPLGNPVPNIDGSDSDVQNATPGTATSPFATELEQLSLERINRARLLPAQEAAKGGIAIDEGVPGQIDASPKPAVAMNSVLREAARRHSRDMLDRNFFAHQNPDGAGPGERVLDAGYTWTTVGENLAWNGTTGTLDLVAIVETQHDNLFVDKGIEGRGHRITMLHPSLREVGISLQRGSFTGRDGTVFTDSLMQTQEYATAATGVTFVLGVVYDDRNGNGQYDHGEGRPNVTVRLGDIVRTTNPGGGYVFPVNLPGNYSLFFPSGQRVDLTIEFGDPNIKVDAIDGTRTSINLGVGLLK